MPLVELVYDADCPHVSAARENLLRAFAAAGLEARWREWRSDDPDAPDHVRGFGSPTILVDRVDVAGAESVTGTRSCRLYEPVNGEYHGGPPTSLIIDALRRSGRSDAAPAVAKVRGSWRGSIAMLPALGAAVLPKLACPACWPAYAGLLSSIGLGLLLESTFLLPLTSGFLAIAVVLLAFGARRRRGYGPFGMGLVSIPMVLVGEFVLESDAWLYGGLAMLVGASMWNSWHVRRRPACPVCIRVESI
jgi:mercuric ion transport protein